MNPLFIAAIQAARRAAEAKRHQEQVSPPPVVSMRRQIAPQPSRTTARPTWWRRLIRWCLRRLGKPLSLVAALLMIGLQATGVG